MLEEHLKGVAAQASDFSSVFKAGEWGFLAGLWHDLGKYSNEFQYMLFAANGVDAHVEKVGRVDHSTSRPPNPRF